MTSLPTPGLVAGPIPEPSLELGDLITRSIGLIASQQHPSGAYAASPTFSAYTGYSWFRDGAFIADAMSAAGRADSASRFHDWAAKVITDRRSQVESIVAAARRGDPVPDEDMLATRFTFLGAEGSDDWWDFQLDGYGTWLWAVIGHAERHNLTLTPWSEGIALAASYLIASWSRPCYDWWEEHTEQRHVSTLGCVGAGLEAVGRAESVANGVRREARDAAFEIRRLVVSEGVVDGRLRKWLGSDEVDASLVALIAPLNWIDAEDPLARATVECVERTLAVQLGVHRYLGDTYYGGGQWPLLSCFLGLAFHRLGDEATATAYLAWAAHTAGPAGIPEQVDEHLLAPERRPEWLERWGQPADPLVWSSAMYVRLALALGIETAGSLR